MFLAAFIIINEHRIFIPLRLVAEYPLWIWFGGVCAIIIVTMGIFCVPELGSAGYVMILNFGQIVSGLAIDHFALFGSEEARMSLARLAGAILVLAGLILATYEKKAGNKAGAKLPVLYIVLSFISGLACSVQVAVNGTLRVVLQSVSKATLISMSVAIISTVAVMLALLLLKGRKGMIDPLYGEKTRFRPWMITGGLFALTVVSGNAAVAPVLGTGPVTILNLVGMIGAGLVIDATGFLGIEKKRITLKKIAGMLLMFAGMAMISL